MPRSIVFVDTYYPGVLRDRGLAGAPAPDADYAALLTTADGIGFGNGGALARAATALGWDAQLIVANSLSLQGAWAREHGLGARWRPGWAYANHVARLPLVGGVLGRLPHVQGTLLAQVKSLRPDVLYVHDLNLVPPALVTELRRHTGLLVGEHASPPPPRAFFTGYDLLVSALPSLVDQFREWGLDAEWVPLGFDARWAVDTPASQRPIEAIFVGSFTRLQPSTAPLLRAVAARIPGLEIYGQAEPRVLADAGLSELYRGPAWGNEMFELLGRSRLVVNRHGAIAGDYAVNMRMYEATGSGAALLIEERRNLADLFAPGVEVETYRSIEEAAEKAAELLADPARLDAVAAAGQARTLRDHTYDRRAERLSELFEARLRAKAAG